MPMTVPAYFTAFKNFAFTRTPSGVLTLRFHTADQGLYLIACTAAPGSRDADALNLLASWHATDNTEDTAPTPARP
jgi:hypothetical protein